MKKQPIHNYTGQGIEGPKYREHQYTDIKEIAKMIRRELKKEMNINFGINIKTHTRFRAGTTGRN